MNSERKAERPVLLVYLPIVFIIPWTIWILMNENGLYGKPIYMMVSAILMWTPALASFICHVIFKRKTIAFSWKPHVKMNAKYYIQSILIPVLLTITGTIVFFLCFPQSFSFKQFESIDIPLSPSVYILLMLCTVILSAVINMFFALGEEAGWRGLLYPILKNRMGTVQSCIVGGVIWGLWHTPVNANGYNYGTAYPGYPWFGIPTMCLFCIAMGIWCMYLAEKTGSIWAPALFHGAVNAVAAIGVLFLNDASLMLLGPTLSGIIPSLISLLFFIPFARKKSHIPYGK